MPHAVILIFSGFLFLFRDRMRIFHFSLRFCNPTFNCVCLLLCWKAAVGVLVVGGQRSKQRARLHTTHDSTLSLPSSSCLCLCLCTCAWSLRATSSLGVFEDNIIHPQLQGTKGISQGSLVALSVSYLCVTVVSLYGTRLHRFPLRQLPLIPIPSSKLEDIRICDGLHHQTYY